MYLHSWPPVSQMVQAGRFLSHLILRSRHGWHAACLLCGACIIGISESVHMRDECMRDECIARLHGWLCWFTIREPPRAPTKLFVTQLPVFTYTLRSLILLQPLAWRLVCRIISSWPRTAGVHARRARIRGLWRHGGLRSQLQAKTKRGIVGSRNPGSPSEGGG